MSNKQSIQTKNAFFFSHDSNARNDQKVLSLRIRYGAEGYGVYFMLLEMLMEASGYELELNYDMLSFSLHARREVIEAVIEDYDLFVFSEKGRIFYSESLKKRLEPLAEIREKRRLAGIKSGEARRARASEKHEKEQKLNTCATDAMSKTNREEESRVEKRREEERKVEQNSVQNASAFGKAKCFEPPTLQEVEHYCQKRKNEVDAQKFIDFYQSKGWMVGRNKMKDWQASIRTWEREEKQKRWQNKIPNIANHNNKVAYESF